MHHKLKPDEVLSFVVVNLYEVILQSKEEDIIDSNSHKRQFIYYINIRVV